MEARSSGLCVGGQGSLDIPVLLHAASRICCADLRSLAHTRASCERTRT
jgi:hypothetical protein